MLWGYAWAQSPGDIPPPTFSPHSRTTHLLESIVSASSRLETAKSGIHDLLVSVAEKLIDGRINQECAAVLWGLVGSNYKKRPCL